MRAQWIENLIVEDNYLLKGDVLHHLVNVIRIDSGESLLLLDGKGLQVETIVESIHKKEIRLKYQRHTVSTRNYQFDLALGMPKREALELCLKEATELGLRKIFLIKSEYSQMRFPETERMNKILVSALEQSNAPFLPEIIEADWETVPWNDFNEVVLLDSQTSGRPTKETPPSFAPRLLVVGPEGGFSPLELTYLHGLERVKIVNLPTPLLRTPTAVATGVGVMLQSLLN